MGRANQNQNQNLASSWAGIAPPRACSDTVIAYASCQVFLLIPTVGQVRRDIRAGSQLCFLASSCCGQLLGKELCLGRLGDLGLSRGQHRDGLAVEGCAGQKQRRRWRRRRRRQSMNSVVEISGDEKGLRSCLRVRRVVAAGGGRQWVGGGGVANLASVC